MSIILTILGLVVYHVYLSHAIRSICKTELQPITPVLTQEQRAQQHERINTLLDGPCLEQKATEILACLEKNKINIGWLPEDDLRILLAYEFWKDGSDVVWNNEENTQTRQECVDHLVHTFGYSN
jgi:hypothetical protein